MSKINPLAWPEAVRAYYYRVASAILIVLAGAGLVTDGTASRVLFLITTLLGLSTGGLATKNTSRTP